MRRVLTPPPPPPPLPHQAQAQAQKKQQQQQQLIAELRRRQVKDHRPVYEGKDGHHRGHHHRWDKESARSSPRVAGSPGPQGPTVTVVIDRSAPRRCTLCYVSVPFTARTAKRGSRFFYLRNQPFLRADALLRSGWKRP
ncbi:Formin-like protein 3 [Merluccius polli]|uniref:Formin-like protein 3 n=1 Tax=Merluccius polli TaxID=89951 RepID=A0AA47MSG6_MERPO|nr:Formin-like protein 3 [Merluccius polli]